MKKPNKNLKLEENETLKEMLIVELHVNVCESMGANTVNTILEGISDYI